MLKFRYLDPEKVKARGGLTALLNYFSTISWKIREDGNQRLEISGAIGGDYAKFQKMCYDSVDIRRLRIEDIYPIMDEIITLIQEITGRHLIKLNKDLARKVSYFLLDVYKIKQEVDLMEVSWGQLEIFRDDLMSMVRSLDLDDLTYPYLLASDYYKLHELRMLVPR